MGHLRMDVDLVALGGDLVNFPSPQSVDDLYNELMKLLDEDEVGSVGKLITPRTMAMHTISSEFLIFPAFGHWGESIDSQVA